MIVPTGSAFFATRTLGPAGTAGAAAACGAAAPANMFLAMTAVITATTSAPTSRASFFTSMARRPPLGLFEQRQTSDKLVKKALGENHERPESDRDSVRNLGPALPIAGLVPGEDDQRQDAAGKAHQHQEADGALRREPQCQSGRELDVTAAHHAGVEGHGEQDEHG